MYNQALSEDMERASSERDVEEADDGHDDIAMDVTDEPDERITLEAQFFHLKERYSIDVCNHERILPIDCMTRPWQYWTAKKQRS